MARQTKLLTLSCLTLFVQAFFTGAQAQTSGGVSRCVSSNTIVLDAPVRESVAIESAPLPFFSSEKIGLSFVIR